MTAAEKRYRMATITLIVVIVWLLWALRGQA